MMNASRFSFVLGIISCFLALLLGAYEYANRTTPLLSVAVDVSDAKLLDDGLYCQDIGFTVVNQSNRNLRIIGIVPFCCSGNYGFGIKEQAFFPNPFRPGDVYYFVGNASFGDAANHENAMLERIALEILVEDESRLVSREVPVKIRPPANN